MKREPRIRLTRDIVGTLPQRVEENDDIFSGRLNFVEGQIDLKAEFICEVIIDPL